MIWSCFWAGGFGPLVIVDGPENQGVYIVILAKNFHPWFKKLVDEEERDFIFHEDGASCHTGGYVKWWKETHQIRGFVSMNGRCQAVIVAKGGPTKY
ncbi:hypothetical protein BCV72DRAFT_270247 [Rhizopus microsporus var. microsporus]|uniref:Tc1-like transposase DDE domain-containing protein n=1 Tax=Rhizopus microsporus var. microsporus TaxID=86635 RepID=A0A1X0RC17_RHIZD|nr:hypothetical protein BCV72DRAFT_270247 [Rhizopus microsporus var. microsporus]